METNSDSLADTAKILEASESILLRKRKAEDEEATITPKRQVATQQKSDQILENSPGNSALLPGISLMKLKRHGLGIELMKLPRFGAKLNAAPADLNRLLRRLTKIYNSKLQAFKWPRYREIVLTDGAHGGTKKRAESFTGRLDSSDMSVEMSRFRGTFSPYFGKHFVTADGEPRTKLTPLEAYFLMDMGTLEVSVSENCVLSMEDVRAMMEEKVPNLSARYTVFSEIHRATQLYAKNYGAPRKALKNSKKEGKNQSESSTSSRWGFSSDETPDQVFELNSDESQPSKPLLNLPEPFQGVNRSWKSDKDARKILGLEAPPTQVVVFSAAELVQVKEIPPFSVVNFQSSSKKAVKVIQEKRPESFDVAFTCYSRISAVGVTTPQFDVAVTDFRRKDIPIADLFLALANRVDSTLPLYVAKDDVGQLSGFAAVLADIPTVSYQSG